MSLGPAWDAKEQVRQAVDIVDLVGSYVQLRRQGRNFVGLCPWHEDSRPSLQVNPERQSFKCWVCDLGGDVFSFMMRAEGVEFREALEMLAERAGVTLGPPPRSDGWSGDEPQHDSAGEKRTLLRLMAWAEEQFHQCLVELPEGEPGRQYLAERGITAESVRRFHLGFAPNRWDWLLERARGTEWKPPLLERVGLLRRKAEGDGVYDWFRGRVMFSIRDARSRPVAFGGRVLPQLADDRAAKYINSPETPLFSKSRELYGMDVARDGIARARGVVVMEGYTDCLMAHQHGLDNAVAVLGTALGDRHLQLLRRYTDSITLTLDGDEAGRRRTNEILDSLLALFERNEVDLRILTLPEGADPCDFIATHGSEAFRRLLEQAVDALEHKFRTVTNGLDILTDTHRASQAVEQLLSALAQARSSSSGGASSKSLLREQQMLGRVAREFRLPEEQLRNRLVSLRREAGRRRGSGERDAGSEEIVASVAEFTLTAWDRELLELVLIDSSILPRIEDTIEPADIQSATARRILAACVRLCDEGQPLDFGRLMSEFDDAHLKNLLVELDESAALKSTADRELWFKDLQDGARRRREQAEHRAALAAARHDPHNVEQLLAQFCQQQKPKHLSEYERRRR